MLSTYYTTALEDWVTNFYTRLRILHPRQIKIENIAKAHGIFIHRKPTHSFYLVNGRYRGIYIDSREPDEKQREMFFHELCHILRHTGNQTMMPEAFRQLQEWDAKNFVRYAAIPYHMFRYIKLDDPNVTEDMSNLFVVSSDLCKERLNQMKNRMELLTQRNSKLIKE